MSHGWQEDVAAFLAHSYRPGIVACASRRYVKLVGRVAVVLVCALGMASRVDAQQTMTWDPNGATVGTGGPGTWDTSSAIWFNGTTFVPWTNGTLDDTQPSTASRSAPTGRSRAAGWLVSPVATAADT
jgi:hypothetical protein